MVDKRTVLIISGRVQGVSYRATTREAAQKLGLTGYARNLSDGRVEVVAEGDGEALVALEQWCRNGPPTAKVESIETSHEPATNEFRDFSIR